MLGNSTITARWLGQADAHDLTVRQKLAQLALDRRADAAAADRANQALQIDVLRADFHRQSVDAFLDHHNYPEAIEEFEVAARLGPTELDQRFALANACIQANQAAKAREVVAALLERAPDCPGTLALMKNLGETVQP